MDHTGRTRALEPPILSDDRKRKKGLYTKTLPLCRPSQATSILFEATLILGAVSMKNRLKTEAGRERGSAAWSPAALCWVSVSGDYHTDGSTLDNLTFAAKVRKTVKKVHLDIRPVLRQIAESQAEFHVVIPTLILIRLATGILGDHPLSLWLLLRHLFDRISRLPGSLFVLDKITR